MKQWSLQDIRPAGSGRGRVERTRTDMRERNPAPQDEKRDDETEDVSVRTRVSEDVSRSRRYEDAPAESAYAGQPLRRKMSLEPSPMRRYMRIGAGIALAGSIAVVAIMHVTATATVTIVPKVLEKDVHVDLVASADGSAGMPIALMRRELQANTVVAAKGIEDVTEPAQGNVTIYNEYSTTAYKLVKNTRVEADGKIFRIQESVAVPGYTTKDGSTIPGSVSVKVVAAEPGEAGNLGPTQFTIPGLQDTPEYTKLYARSTEAFMGGFIGKRAVVADADLDASRGAMQEKLAEELRASIAEERVAGQVIYANAAVITYTDVVEAIAGSDAQANYVVRGTITVPVFDTMQLAHAIVGAGDQVAYRIMKPEALAFAYSGNTVGILDEHTPITFSLTGHAVLVAEIPREEFAGALVGVDRDALSGIVAQHAGIDRINYTISVPWKQRFPENPDKITLDIVIPEE